MNEFDSESQTSQPQRAVASSTSARKRRPHPAQRARRISGLASIAGMLAVTGYLASGRPASYNSSTAAASTATDQATALVDTPSSANPDAGKDNGYEYTLGVDDGVTYTAAAPNPTTTSPAITTTTQQTTVTTAKVVAAKPAKKPVSRSHGS